jgi:hypothetical protein
MCAGITGDRREERNVLPEREPAPFMFVDDIYTESGHEVSRYVYIEEKQAMPPVSEAQRRAMRAAAAGKSTLGISKKVGQEFVKADKGGKLPRKVKKEKK